MPFTSRFQHPGAPLAVVLCALAVGAAACGGGADDDATVADEAPAQTATQLADPPAGQPGERTAPTPGRDRDDDERAATPRERAERSVERSLERVGQAYAKGDVESVCAMVTGAQAKSRKQAADACGASFGRFLELARKSGALDALGDMRVLDVEVDGDTAVATMRVGGRTRRVDLVKSGDGWRLAGGLGIPGPDPSQGVPGQR